jgi:hypothetical protein
MCRDFFNFGSLGGHLLPAYATVPPRSRGLAMPLTNRLYIFSTDSEKFKGNRKIDKSRLFLLSFVKFFHCL